MTFALCQCVCECACVLGTCWSFGCWPLDWAEGCECEWTRTGYPPWVAFWFAMHFDFPTHPQAPLISFLYCIYFCRHSYPSVRLFVCPSLCPPCLSRSRSECLNKIKSVPACAAAGSYRMNGSHCSAQHSLPTPLSPSPHLAPSPYCAPTRPHHNLPVQKIKKNRAQKMHRQTSCGFSGI